MGDVEQASGGVVVAGGVFSCAMRYAGLLGLVLLSACGSLTSADYEPPPADPSRDPAALREGSILFACGGWHSGKKPTDSKILVDVIFLRSTAEGPFDRTTWLDRVLAARYGAQIVYTFNSNAARVWIAPRDVPRLTAIAPQILSVPDPRRHDWPVTVFFKATHRYTPNDLARFARLGGRVTYHYDAFNGFAGILPDASIPLLRADPSVRLVAGSAGVLCLA